jgi:homoserine kinase type II
MILRVVPPLVRYFYCHDLANLMQLPTTVRAILNEYPAECQPSRLVPLGAAGGFSGAEFWRLETPRGVLCLRRWPREHPTPERLAWIHAVVQYVALCGFRLFAEPIPISDGGSFVERNGDLWELTPWLPGRADYHKCPSQKKLAAAFSALASMHVAASSFLSIDEDVAFGPSPAISDRLNMVTRLIKGRLTELRSAVTNGSQSQVGWTEYFHDILSFVEPRLRELESSLQAVASVEVPLQPCLRDIWHDHVLFVGDDVTGIVDLGAMRVETVAADVARLAGSLCGANQQDWAAAVNAYEAVRPLTDAERTLIPVLDRSQTLLAGINWIEWVYVERRCFADPVAVEKRITDIHSRLAASIMPTIMDRGWVE